MRNMKKMLVRLGAVLILIGVLMSTISVPAFAEEGEVPPPTISSSNVSVTAGNYVTVYLQVQNFVSVGAIDLYAFYDPDVLTLVNSNKQSVANYAQVSINTDTPGAACFSAVSTDGMSGNGYIWSLYFKINQNVDAGTYLIDFAVGNAYDLSLEPIEIKATTCSVIVTKPAPSVTPKNIKVYAQYSAKRYEKGDNLNIRYYTSSASGMASAEFIITYDPYMLSPTEITLGTKLTSANGAIWSINDKTPGYIKISYASLEGVTGSVNPLVDIGFDVIGDIVVNSSSVVEMTLDHPYDSALNAMTGSKATASLSMSPTEDSIILPEILLGNAVLLEDTLYLEVLAPGETGLAAGDFVLTYDTNLFECVSIESCSEQCMVIGNIKHAEGKVTFSFICEDGISEDTALARLAFRINQCTDLIPTFSLWGKNLVTPQYEKIDVTYGSPSLQIDLSHQLVHVKGQKPTCEQDGWNDYVVCERCDYSTMREILATGHSYNAIVTEPTCTERGYTTHTCHCGDSHINNYVDALGHDMSDWYIVTAPTCTENGGEKRDCDRCDHFETNVLEATGHSHEIVVTEPTCTERGYTTHTCHCGDSYIDNYVDALGHDMSDWFTVDEPTCTENGEEKRDCDRCDHFETNVLDATGHDYEILVTVSTCTEKGYTTHTCHCGDSYVDSYVDALGHNFGEWFTVTAPTCTEKGYTTHTCHCGDSYVDSYVDALGHNFGEWYTVTAPTCTENGEEKRECDRCDHFETNVLKATGHSYDAVVTEPTCTERGYTTHTCHCSDTYIDSYVDALGHDLGKWYTVTDPTCTENGEEKRECDRCDHFETNVLEAVGHDYRIVVTEPTCTDQGYTTHTCHCGDSYVDSYVDALGHSFGEWFTVTAPTCTENGEEKRDCDHCDHFEMNVLEAVGHDYELVVTEPTCTEKGYTTHTCHCGDSYVDSYVDALGHNFGEWYTVTAPTCTENGEEKRDCDRCDHFETNVLEATGHSHDAVVTAPTCTERGYTTHTCHCGDSYVDSYVDALGHDFGEWYTVTAPTCTENGEEKRDCDRCDHFETNVLEAVGHDYELVVTEPTCTDQGYTTHTCHCGDSYINNYVDALGHNFGDWYTVTAPTCIENGEEKRDCDHCDHFETNVLEATGHSHDAVVTAPTCTERGYTTHTCHCGDSYVDNYVDPIGHHYVAEELEDVIKHTCSNCGDSHTEEISFDSVSLKNTLFTTAWGMDFVTSIEAKLPIVKGAKFHLYYNGEVASLIELIGSDKIQITSDNGKLTIKVLEDIAADEVLLTLTFTTSEYLTSGSYTLLTVDESSAELCEFTDLVIYQMGDVNLDGKINSRDATMIKQYVVKMLELTDVQKVYANVYVDTDKNGAPLISSRDALLIQQYVVKMDVELGNRVDVTFSYETEEGEDQPEIQEKTYSICTGHIFTVAPEAPEGYVWSESKTQEIVPDFTVPIEENKKYYLIKRKEN